MSTREQATGADLVGIGIVCAAGGVYFTLVGLGYVPSPSDAHAPGPIIVAAGLAFLFAGLVCVLRARAGMPDHQDEVPENAPTWIKLAYRALGIGVAGTLALIGTWIAIGSGPRPFSMSTPFGEMRTLGETVGRTIFGLGAVIVWIYVIALTVGTVRKFFTGSKS